MNKIRWYDPNEDISGSKIQDYIIKRIEFLDKVWIDGAKYHTLQIEPYPGETYLSYAVPYGAGFDDFPDASYLRNPNGGENDGNDGGEIIWYDWETGAVYHPGEIVKKDMVLTRQNPREKAPFRFPSRRRVVAVSLCIALFASFAALVRTDAERRRTENGDDRKIKID